MADNEEEVTTTDSPTENETIDEGHSPDGQEGDDNSQEDEKENLSFDKHPRWKQREEEWNKRFDEQESRIQSRIEQAIKDAVKNLPSSVANADSLPVQIPAWFGGDEAQWKAFKADQKRELDQVVAMAVKEAVGEVSKTQTAQERAVQEANKHFHDSIQRIEYENKTKVDPNELLQYVLDNKIIDPTTQRWDYEKGYRWMMLEKGQGSSKPGADRQGRKNIAGATMKERGGTGRESEVVVPNSETFSNPNNRPW